MSRTCCWKEETVCNLKTVVLENDLLRVRILVGKGAEIYELIYKPKNMDVLLKKSYGLTPYKELDLYKERISWYGAVYTGGWSDVVPDRGTYGDVYLVQKNSGIAATLPWDYEMTVTEPDKVEICCFVLLPVFPLLVKKYITLETGSSVLKVRETVTHKGELPMDFCWTQHATFGGDFLDESCTIQLPAEKTLRAYEFHDRKPEDDQDYHNYESPVERVEFADGSILDMTKAPPRAFVGEHFITMHDLKEPRASITNATKGVRVQIDWDIEAYPYLRYWCDNHKDSYTVALEPASHLFDGFTDSRRFGTYWHMEPGESRDIWMNCTIEEI